MIDMFAESISSSDIFKILDHCRKYDNRYLFQSKNPERFKQFENDFPQDTILGTTIETDLRFEVMGNTPGPMDRALAMNRIKKFKKTVTVEPVLDFDPMSLWNLICICDPDWVNIGADSKGHNLPEPSQDKIKALVENLRHEGIEIKLKSNLKRLIKDKDFLVREFPEEK